MKKLFYLIAVPCIALVSCVKEEAVETQQNKDNDNDIIQIHAFCDDELTKTSYELEGDTYVFNWLKGDKIAVQAERKSNGYNDDTFEFTNSSEKGTIATFSAAANNNFNLGNYAFYPYRYPSQYSSTFSYTGPYGQKNISYGTNYADLSFLKSGTAVADQEAADAATYATVRLFGTITEDKDKPMQHIPLIGIKKGTTNDYYFKAATGVLKVTVKNLPASAKQIRLNATDYALNGYFVFDTNGEIKESYKKEGDGLKYMNITTTGDESRDFFFPIPTGTIPEGKLVVSITDGTNVLYTVTSKQDITLTRGEITELPSISIPAISATIDGNATAPVLHLTQPTGYAFKFGITNAADNVPSSYAAGAVFSNGSVDKWTIANAYKPASSGKWFLHYTVYRKNTDIVKAKGYIPFYFLTGDDNTSYCVNYQMAYTTDNGNAYVGLKLEQSDNASKGNIRLTKFGDLSGTYYGAYSSGTSGNNLVLFDTYAKAFTPGYYIYSSTDGTTNSQNARPNLYFTIGSDTSSDPNYDSQNWTLTSAEYVVVEGGGSSSSYQYMRGNVAYNIAGAVNGNGNAGEDDVVFGKSWTPTLSANNLEYSGVNLYTKTLTVPSGVNKVSFKVVKNNSWDNGSWPESDENKEVDIDPGFSGNKTLTIYFNSSTGVITTSVAYSSEYKLYILQESLAASEDGSWGSLTTRTVSCSTYNFTRVDDTVFGEYTYNTYLIPDALVDGSTERDIDYRGVYQDNKYGGEICLKKTFATSTKDYYFRTNGILYTEVEDPEHPGAITGADTPRFYVRTNVTPLYCHMWGGGSETSWPGSQFVQTTAKQWGDSWYYVDILSGATNYKFNSGWEQDNQTLTDSTKSYYYNLYYYDNTCHVAIEAW